MATFIVVSTYDLKKIEHIVCPFYDSGTNQCTLINSYMVCKGQFPKLNITNRLRKDLQEKNKVKECPLTKGDIKVHWVNEGETLGKTKNIHEARSSG